MALKPSTQGIPRLISIFTFLVATLLLSSSLTCQGRDKKRIDWYELDRDVNEAKRKSLKRVERSRTGSINDTTVAELKLMEFDLAVRAGEEAAARKALVELKPHLVGVDSPQSTLSDVADFLIGRKQWALAQYFLELYPSAHPGWGYIFVQNMAGQSKNTDSWLLARYQADGQSAYWLSERMRYRRDQGTAAVLVKEIENKIRAAGKNAQDRADNDRTLAAVLAYLGALEAGGQSVDLTWLPGAFMPSLAFQQAKLGSSLTQRSPEAAIAYLLRAQSTAVTAADRQLFKEEMRHRSAMQSALEDADKSIRLGAKLALAEAYKNKGENEKAQKVLVELNAESKKNGGVMPFYALSQAAGQIQSQMTQRPLEASIKAAEPENKNSYDYWLGRARYYQGGKDEAKTIEALDKALALTKLPGHGAGESDIVARQIVVDAYAYHYKNTNRPEQASALYWKEYDQSNSALLRTRLMSSVQNMDGKLISYKNERVFDYLASRKTWDYLEQHLLQNLVESTGVDKKSGGAARQALWSRLEKLAEKRTAQSDPDFSRPYNLGWVMTRKEETRRAMPLLKQAVKGIKDKEKLQEAQFTLFEANLELGNWQEAEAAWPAVRTRLTATEEPVWLSKIAVEAARAGATKEALRLWKAKDNLDKTCLGPLSELAGLGMKKTLLDYYLTMQKDSPTSTIPKEARKILEK